MINNCIDTSILMGLRQFTRDYFQISLSDPGDSDVTVATATANYPSGPGGSRSNPFLSLDNMTTSPSLSAIPEHKPPYGSCTHDYRYGFRSIPLPYVYQEVDSDEDDDMIEPTPEIEDAVLDPLFDAAFSAAFPQETIDKIHRVLKDSTDKVEGKRPHEKKVSEAWVRV